MDPTGHHHRMMLPIVIGEVADSLTLAGLLGEVAFQAGLGEWRVVSRLSGSSQCEYSQCREKSGDSRKQKQPFTTPGEEEPR